MKVNFSKKRKRQCTGRLTITPISGKLPKVPSSGNSFVRVEVDDHVNENNPKKGGGTNPKWKKKGMTFARTAETKIVEISIWDKSAD